MNIIYGINSQKKVNQSLKYIQFNPFRKTPPIIESTPRETAHFILKESTNNKSLSELNHIGSNPQGYTQFSIL